MWSKRQSRRRSRCATSVLSSSIGPVSGDAPTKAHIPQEREFEVIERHEEPVVEKRARNVEEVVVRTDASERTETVRDTVRQTRVDVENEAGGRADNLERPVPTRNP
jgi:stress response protein YsnF